MKVKLLNLKKLAYGSYRLTLEHGSGYFKAAAKHTDPCKERRQGIVIDSGEEIYSKLELTLHPAQYAEFITKGILTLELSKSEPIGLMAD